MGAEEEHKNEDEPQVKKKTKQEIEKEIMRHKNYEKALALLNLDEKPEVITSLAFLSVNKGDFVRLNKGLFDDFYKIGKILGIGKSHA